MNEAEKFITEHTRRCSNELVPNGYLEWVTPDDALRACEIIKQETIKQVCEWLKQHSYDYLVRDMYKACDKCIESLEQLIKTMED